MPNTPPATAPLSSPARRERNERSDVSAIEALDASGHLTPRTIAVLVLLRVQERTAVFLANALGESRRAVERLLQEMTVLKLIATVGGYRSHTAYRLAPPGKAWLVARGHVREQLEK